MQKIFTYWQVRQEKKQHLSIIKIIFMTKKIKFIFLFMQKIFTYWQVREENSTIWIA